MDRPDFVVVSADKHVAAYTSAGAAINMPPMVAEAWAREPDVQVIVLRSEPAMVEGCIRANEAYRRHMATAKRGTR